jgi:peptide chain release factor 2
VRGPYAYGYLSAERGTHRLVRLSPFDSARRRHTSFALVQVMPEVQQDMEVQIDLGDVRVDTYRSTGAGGQHVNKTDSAVRLTHIPTGIVVTCQNERSQLQNREVAMTILRSRLLERRIQEQEAESARLRGQFVAADFGSQIRNYVLHPYTLVKDLRSGVETSNVQAVLDGDLDAFMEGFLRWQVGRNSDAA